MVTGIGTWGRLTGGQVRWVTGVTWGLETRFCTWLTSRTVSPAVVPLLPRSAMYSRLPSSETLSPCGLIPRWVQRRVGSAGLDTSTADSVPPPALLTQKVLPSGEKVPSWPRTPIGRLDFN